MFHNFPVSHRSDVFVLAIDVDLTLVDSLSPWVKMFNIGVESLPTPEPDEVLDLVPWMQGMGINNPLSYWKRSDLYDDMKPNQSFIMFCKRLVASLKFYTGKEVETIVVSSCFPEHENSKRELVKRVFGDKTPFISTSAKHLVDFDLIIDDSMGVAFNCISAGKNVLHAPNPMSNPSKGTRLNPRFFYPGYDGKGWPYNWVGVDAKELVVELLKSSNK